MAVIGEFKMMTEAETARLAAALAGLCRTGDLMLLEGPLGAGKTAFARAFINALPGPDGAPVEEEVPSPTFTLQQSYERSPAPVFHFDLYRVEDPEELVELGFEDARAEGVTLVEWPDRLGRFRSDEALLLTFTYGATETARSLRLDGQADWAARLAGVVT